MNYDTKASSSSSLRNSLLVHHSKPSSFFSALEEELLLDDVLELWVEMELLEALRLRDVANFLFLVLLCLRLLPMEKAARWNLLERLQSSSQTIKRLWSWPFPMENAAKASELALRPALMQGQWPQEQLPGSQEQLVGSQEQLP